MHIPQGMLNGTVCPVTAALSSAVVGTAVYFALKSKDKPDAKRFFMTTSLIFVMQMLNFPIQSGTSGHFLGGAFAAYMLGTPFAAIAMSIVLTIQAVVFGDGGVTTLGANILNMVLIGTVLPGIVIGKFKNEKNTIKKYSVIAFSAFGAVTAAATACAVEVGISKVFEMKSGIAAMVGVHSVIGSAEAIITVILCAVAVKGLMRGKAFLILIAGLVAATPFASSKPDGLEYVTEKLGSYQGIENYFKTVFYDYSISFIKESYISTAGSALAGVIIIGLITMGIYFKRAKK